MNNNVQFEGFLDDISPQQLQFISGVLDKQGFGQAKVIIEVLGKAGDNYAADVRRIIAKQDENELRMVAKIASKIGLVRDAMYMRSLFTNEAKMYTDVLPKFTGLEKEADIPQAERLKYATCYGTYLEDMDEIILLEDLQCHKYTTFDRFKSLSNETVKVIFKNLAKLHGYSFVLLHQEPEAFESLTDSLVNVWNQEMNKEMMNGFKKMEEGAVKALDNEVYAKYIKLANMVDISRELTQFENIDSKYRAIQHGDAWTNNIMFQIEDDKIISCCMIDYQMVKVASPASDIGYMVFNCTDYDTRAEHYYKWIDYYHSELEKVSSIFGLKVKEVYSRERFTADLKRYGKMSLAHSLFASTILVKENAEAAKYKEALQTFDKEKNNLEKLMESTSILNSNETTLELFRKRVKEIIDTHIDLEYIDV